VNRRTLVVAAVAAVVIAAALIGISVVSSGGDSSSASTTSTASSSPGFAPISTASLATLKGLPQHGATLGNPNAPVTLYEYADFQCPFCGHFAQASLPTVIERWVRPGKVKLVFNGLSFLGPDSTKALQFAVAAQAHDRLWQAVELLYANQGTENTGWVTDPLLRSVARASGLDPAATLAAANAVPGSKIDALNTAGNDAGVSGTPSFFVARRGGTPIQVGQGALTPDALAPAIQAALTQ